jgi:tRNA threonylcarbamoyl adenosine modification protein YeaZ
VLVLALDTATPAVTVAVADRRAVLAGETAVDPRRHGELLAPLIESVLRRARVTIADLTGIAVGTGPGPYTGLRAGVMTANALGSALGIPVLGVCTLDVIASEAADSAGGRPFLVATDARRRELYWARYSPSGERVSGPSVSPAAGLPADGLAAGQGPLLYPQLAVTAIGPEYPSAARLAQVSVERLSRLTPAGPAQPIYLRRPDAREPGPPKKVTAR